MKDGIYRLEINRKPALKREQTKERTHLVITGESEVKKSETKNVTAKSSGGSAKVTMVQTAEHRFCPNRAHVRWFDLAVIRSVFIQTEMSP